MMRCKHAVLPLVAALAGAAGALPTTALATAQAAADAESATFNTSLLVFPVDVSLFAQGNPVPAGDYRVDVYLNESWQGKHRVRFELPAPDARVAQPCYDASLLDAIGLDAGHLAADLRAQVEAGEFLCAPLASLIPQTSADFDSGLQRLNLTAPQAVLARRPRGYVDPRRWDAGIPAARLAWDYNLWHTEQARSRQTSQYLGLRGGVNLGDWRLRYRGTVTHASGGSGNGSGFQWDHSALYLERALPKLQSALVVGDATTSSSVFDSLSFRGLRLETDDRMQPDTRNGFAPVISGIAQSNARVAISQRGVQIFETAVPPGPFVIDDLHPNGSGGDLLVTITEADGSVHSFTVAYASLPQLLRPGRLHYSVAAGRYRDRNLHDEPLFGSGSVALGVNNTVTAYGGVLFAQGYDAMSGGAALNLPFGAVSLDATYARTFLGDKTYTGTGWRLAFSKLLADTNTDFSLALLRTASRNYLEPGQAFTLRDQFRRGLFTEAGPLAQRRHQFSVNVNQQLPGNWGAVSLSGSVQDYWQASGRDVQYSLGYGRSLGRAQVSVNILRSKNSADRWENQYLVSLSLPLGIGGGNPLYLNSSLAHRPDGQSVQTSVSGTAGEAGQHSYNLYTSVDHQNGHAARGGAGASVATTTPVARLAASVAASAGRARQLGLNASGGVVAFKDGVVFAPELGETIGIVQARHAAGVAVAGTPGVRLDARGHAIVPNLQAYRENEVTLDPKGVSTDVELLASGQRVAPSAGAVVLLQYPTRYGYSVLATLTRPDGGEIPFAASVFETSTEGSNGGNDTDQGAAHNTGLAQPVGHVAQGQRALLRVSQTQGELTVRWGAGADQQCHFDYDLRAGAERRGDGAAQDQFRRLEAVCA